MKESTTQARLTYIMAKKNMKLVDLVEKCKPYCEEYGVKLTKGQISEYMHGKSEPKQDKIFVLAKALGVSETYLMGWSPLPPTKRIPLLGKIACGEPITAIEHPDDYVDVPEFVSADFALLCQGDSMINARILDGDIVYIRRQSCVENGEIAAVSIDGEATLKRVFFQNGTILLQAENPAFAPIILSGDQVQDVQILGKATYFVSKAR